MSGDGWSPSALPPGPFRRPFCRCRHCSCRRLPPNTASAAAPKTNDCSNLNLSNSNPKHIFKRHQPQTPAVDQSQLSDRLKRYLGCASALAAARAHKHHAAVQHEALQAGAAERACVEAANLLNAALGAADADAAWRAALEAEARIVEARRVKIEKDRLYVSMQPIPSDAPRLPASKLLVTPVPYEGERSKSVGAELGM